MGDGYLCEAELAVEYPGEDVQQMILDADVDGNGLIDLNEFIHVVEQSERLGF